MAELDVAQCCRWRLLGRTQRIACDPAAHVLKAHLGRGQSLPALGAAGEHQLAQHVILDEGEERVVALVLVMMAVDVGDQEVVEAAGDRLLTRMGEQAAGVEFFNRYAAAPIRQQVHPVSPKRPNPGSRDPPPRPSAGAEPGRAELRPDT